MTVRVAATPAARDAIARLRAEWGALMFVQVVGCAGDSAPMCYPAGDLGTGDEELATGAVDGCPFHVETRLYRAWGEPELLLDVEPGYPEGFSLPPGPGTRFVTRTPPGTPYPPPSLGPACAAGPAVEVPARAAPPPRAA